MTELRPRILVLGVYTELEAWVIFDGILMRAMLADWPEG